MTKILKGLKLLNEFIAGLLPISILTSGLLLLAYFYKNGFFPMVNLSSFSYLLICIFLFAILIILYISFPLIISTLSVKQLVDEIKEDERFKKL